VFTPSLWHIVRKKMKLEGSENVKYDTDLDGQVDMLAPHTHTRDQITDFFAAPFWDNIPDKPSSLVNFTVNDVTGSRSVNTTYTASKPLIVILTVTVSSDAITAYVDGNPVAEINPWESWINAGITLTTTMTFAVPAGSTYRVETANETIIERWVEVELTA